MNNKIMTQNNQDRGVNNGSHLRWCISVWTDCQSLISVFSKQAAGAVGTALVTGVVPDPPAEQSKGRDTEWEVMGVMGVTQREVSAVGPGERAAEVGCGGHDSFLKEEILSWGLSWGWEGNG